MSLRISRDSLSWSLRQALNYGDTDIFPALFEFQAIEHDQERVFSWIESEDLLRWKVRTQRRCLAPKHKFGFRIATQLDPIDFLIFTALVYEIGTDLERSRVSTDKQIVHSYRFHPDDTGRMYDQNIGYHTFTRRSRQIMRDESIKFVIVADIADFFPRLYHHRLVNALRSATDHENHALAIDRLVNGWNESYSYGIPVGSQASRLLAEVAITDIDQVLLSENVTYTRFSDDFRIFCSTSRQAYEKLALLANALFENHGLTLQQQKTRIISRETFQSQYLFTEREEEMNRLSSTFSQLLEELGIEDPYEQFEWENLSEEQQNRIAALNLSQLLEEESEQEILNIPLTKFVLRRLSQINDVEPLEFILRNIERFYPVIPDVVTYIRTIRDISEKQRREVGKRVLEMTQDSTVSHLEYHRMWLLSLFAESTEFDNEAHFVNSYSRFGDHFWTRKMTLALGRAQQDGWFRQRKRSWSELGPWTRRAFLYGASCLSNDERRHWYNSLMPRLDQLELAVTAYARQHPM